MWAGSADRKAFHQGGGKSDRGGAPDHPLRLKRFEALARASGSPRSRAQDQPVKVAVLRDHGQFAAANLTRSRPPGRRPDLDQFGLTIAFHPASPRPSRPAPAPAGAIPARESLYGRAREATLDEGPADHQTLRTGPKTRESEVNPWVVAHHKVLAGLYFHRTEGGSGVLVHLRQPRFVKELAIDIDLSVPPGDGLPGSPITRLMRSLIPGVLSSAGFLKTMMMLPR